MGKKAKLTSVKRVIILCIVPNMKETYENTKLLFDLTKIINIPFKFDCDFKLLLIDIGQQSASAMYPCPYCFVSLKDLRKKNDLNIIETEDSSSTAGCSSNTESLQSNDSKLKTFGDLRNDFGKFELTGKNLKYSKECHSTINMPLFVERDDITVLEKCIIPELHILLGFVNHLFWDGLIPLLEEEEALMWPKSLGLIPKNYHGKCFEGGACRKLLKEADKLNNPRIYKNGGCFAIVPYINAFKAMNKVVNCCFKSDKVGEGLNEHLKELRRALDAIENLSETVKIHVLKEHIEKCLEFIENDYGLGLWSEQCGESIHREFLEIRSRYFVNDIDNELYSIQLLRAVIEFSSLNI